MTDNALFPEYFPFVVTCQTSDCENFEIPIELMFESAESFVICGPCSNQITSIEPAPKTSK